MFFKSILIYDTIQLLIKHFLYRYIYILTSIFSDLNDLHPCLL